MSFAVWVLTFLVWLPDGGLQPPVVYTFETQADCLTAEVQAESEAEAINAQTPYTLRMSWSASCDLRINTSEKIGA